MTKGSKIVFCVSLLLTVVQILLRVCTSPGEVVLHVQGAAPVDMSMFYKVMEQDRYSEKTLIQCRATHNKRSFALPENALTDSLRLDFGGKAANFKITGLTMSRRYFFKSFISAEELKTLYTPNALMSWKLQDGVLQVTTRANDPYIVPENGKLALDPLAGISFSAVLNQFCFFAAFLLIGMAIVCRGKLTELYDRFVKPYRWYVALVLFFGGLTVLFTGISDWKFLPHSGMVYGGILILLIALHIADVILAKRDREKALANPKAPRPKRAMDMTMVYFRAFAIICIVVGHYTNVSGWYIVSQDTKWIIKLSHALFSNDTIYFLFISGYLFYYLTDQYTGYWEKWKFVRTQGKFNLPVFYRKKVTNVILPYLLISVLCAVYITRTGDYSGFVGGGFTWAQFPHRLVKDFMQMQFWYIPFIAIVFLFIPLVLVLPRKVFYGLLIPAVICSLVIPRPSDMIQFSGFLFFISSFFIGIWYAMERETLLPMFRKYFWYFLAGALICSYVIFAEKLSHASFSSITTIHKWCLLPVVIVLLEKIKDKKITILTTIANLSFTLYFFHMMIVQKFFIKVSRILVDAGVTLPVEICIVRVTAAFFFLLVLSWCLKVLTGRFSRSMIGS